MLAGGCHCGNLGVVFETSSAPETFEVRACGCAFCRAHGALSVTDPGRLSRYEFALRTAEFLVCTTCGVYLGAYFDAGDAAYAVLNLNALEARDRFPAARRADWSGETAESRRARRVERWTPADRF